MSESHKRTLSNDEIRLRVLNIYANFVTDVDPDRLSDYLKQEEVISISQWNDICGKNPTSNARCRALLDFLLSGTNPRAFLVVRSVLERKNRHLFLRIDDDASCLTEERNTIQNLQRQLQNKDEWIQLLERDKCQLTGERDRFRQMVDELQTKLDRCQCQHKKERQSSVPHLKLSAMRNVNAGVKEGETGYSAIRDRSTALRRSKSVKYLAKPKDPVTQLTEDSGLIGDGANMTIADHSHRQPLHKEEQPVFVADRSTSEPQEGEPKITIIRSQSRRPAASNSTIFSSMRRTTTLASTQYEPCEIEQNSATLRPRSNKLSASNSTNFSSIGRRSPLMPRQIERTEPYLIKEIKTKASTDKGEAIHGIAILDTELFIISRVSSDMEIYDIYRLSLVRIVKLNVLEAPWDIVSCKINRCLYVMNWKGQSNTIVRVHPRGTVITEWPTGSNCGRLSITQESNIILAAYKTDTIIEYTAEGGFVRKIKLPYTLAHPQHAIKLNNGNLLLIHGMYDDYQHRLCILDGFESVLASFGGEKALGREKLRGPIYLTVDSSGSILVAEYENSRVIEVSQSLQFKRVLLSKEKHEIRDAWSMHLDEENSRLFLVDNAYHNSDNQLKDGRVLVFSYK